MEPSLFGVAGLPGRDNETQVMDEWSFCSILGKRRCAEVSPFVLPEALLLNTLPSISIRYSRNTGTRGLRKTISNGWPTMG